MELSAGIILIIESIVLNTMNMLRVPLEEKLITRME
jgi:hypothetical protein